MSCVSIISARARAQVQWYFVHCFLLTPWCLLGPGCACQWLRVCPAGSRPLGDRRAVSLSGLVLKATTVSSQLGLQDCICAGHPTCSKFVCSTWKLLREVERLASGAPNPSLTVAQVPWYRLRYHKKNDIRRPQYHKLMISVAKTYELYHDVIGNIISFWYHCQNHVFFSISYRISWLIS